MKTIKPLAGLISPFGTTAIKPLLCISPDTKIPPMPAMAAGAQMGAREDQARLAQQGLAARAYGQMAGMSAAAGQAQAGHELFRELVPVNSRVS